MDEEEKKYLDKLSEAFFLILKGRKAVPVELPENYPDNELRQLIGYVNRFIDGYEDFSWAMESVIRGSLDFDLPKGNMTALRLLKTLQPSLRHLTWKTQQIATGDFSHQIDFMGDFSVAFNSMTRQLKESFDKIADQNRQLQQAFDQIQQEKEKSDRLLLNILPGRVANDLKATGQTVPELFEQVTVMFSDIVGFTRTSSTLAPQTLINELNELFTSFDIIIDRNRCERIKTIGDAYFAVSGMNQHRDGAVEDMVDAALEILRYLESRNAVSPLKWEVRIGIHTGSAVGGVVGIRKYIYDLFGDTINTACRMEQLSDPMRINVSGTTGELIREKFELTEREEQSVKGKGQMKMYFVNRRKPLFEERQTLKLWSI